MSSVTIVKGIGPVRDRANELAPESRSPSHMAFAEEDISSMLRLNIRSWHLGCNREVRHKVEGGMDSNYVFLCGVMWCNYGSNDAGKELLRAVDSSDPSTKALAWAMLARGKTHQRELTSDSERSTS